MGWERMDMKWERRAGKYLEHGGVYGRGERGLGGGIG